MCAGAEQTLATFLHVPIQIALNSTQTGPVKPTGLHLTNGSFNQGGLDILLGVESVVFKVLQPLTCLRQVAFQIQFIVAGLLFLQLTHLLNLRDLSVFVLPYALLIKRVGILSPVKVLKIPTRPCLRSTSSNPLL